MYKTILLAYDGTSATALRQSAELARLAKAELHLLGIVATTGTAALALSAGAYNVFTMEREYIEKALESAARDLDGQDLKVTARIREGNPANEIVAHAHEINADLAVLGHSDKGILARWFEGSVGTKLINNLPCSLLIATES